MEYIEVSAKTVNDAIDKACMDLGTPSDMLDIQIISEGNTGFLGFGSKPAVIKVCKKEDLEAEAKAAEKAAMEKAKAEKAAKEKAAAEAKKNEAPKGQKDNKKQFQKKNNNNGNKKKNAPVKDEKPAEPREEKKPVVIPQLTEEQVAKITEEAKKFLEGTFKAMGIEAVIKMEYDAEEGCLNADFEGEDMGVLIGKRGQTLDSLQYLTSLVINKDSKDYVRVKLDTENYRKRRKDTLENLAKNIANKVKKTRRPVVLEPMNPYERRIIHSALQGNKAVETYSEGNEPYRHIVIKPSRQ